MWLFYYLTLKLCAILFPAFRNYLTSIYIICIFHLCFLNNSFKKTQFSHSLVCLALIPELWFSPIHEYVLNVF